MAALLSTRVDMNSVPKRHQADDPSPGGICRSFLAIGEFSDFLCYVFQGGPLCIGAAPAPAELFDEYDENYEEACQQGLALAGEGRDYFAAERVAFTRQWLNKLHFPSPENITDFGCGAGNRTPHFRNYFLNGRVVGLDVSQKYRPGQAALCQ